MTSVLGILDPAVPANCSHETAGKLWRLSGFAQAFWLMVTSKCSHGLARKPPIRTGFYGDLDKSSGVAVWTFSISRSENEPFGKFSESPWD